MTSRAARLCRCAPPTPAPRSALAEAAGPAVRRPDGRPGAAQARSSPPTGGPGRLPREHVKLAAARHGHATAYHGVRAPVYLLLTALVGARGASAAPSRALLAWWHVPDTAQAGAAGRRGRAAVTTTCGSTRPGKETRTARGLILAGCAVVVAWPRWSSWPQAPPWAWVAAGRGRAAAAGPGRPPGAQADRHRRHPARRRCRPPTRTSSPARSGRWVSPGSTGGSATARQLVFPSPVREDGPGLAGRG